MVGPRCRLRARALESLLLVVVIAVFGAGCGDAPAPASNTDATLVPRVDTEETTPVAPAEPRPTVVFLGDSLTSGYGVDENEAFPALIADALAADGRPVRLVNAGVNGDTTAGGLARLDWLLRQTPEVLVVGLGGNDGLRGQDPAMSKANLRGIIERARAAGVTVVLLGMQLPPNYGRDYLERFRAIYPALAGEYDVILVPFLLEGVGGESELNLPDGIHPNPRGHAIVARTVAPYVRDALDRALGGAGDLGRDDTP